MAWTKPSSRPQRCLSVWASASICSWLLTSISRISGVGFIRLALFSVSDITAEAGEHDIGALVLGRLRNGKGDAGRGEDAGDQDLLPFQDARHRGPILSDRSWRLYRVSRSLRRFLNSSLSISPRANPCSRGPSAPSGRTF